MFPCEVSESDWAHIFFSALIVYAITDGDEHDTTNEIFIFSLIT